MNRVAKFLGKAIPEEKMAGFVDHLSFDKMKNNAAVNKDEQIKVKRSNDFVSD